MAKPRSPWFPAHKCFTWSRCAAAELITLMGPDKAFNLLVEAGDGDVPKALNALKIGVLTAPQTVAGIVDPGADADYHCDSRKT